MFTRFPYSLLVGIASVVLLATLTIPSTANARNLTAPSRCSVDVDDIVFGTPDPGTTGPFSVSYAEYGDFEESIDLPGINFGVEFLAEVHYPEELDCGPFPIVFMMHGSHATCVDGNGGLGQTWPCLGGETPLPNYQGYRYLANLLASHGIVTVSISANSINANAETNLDARARLFLRHIGYWTQATQVGNGDFGVTFLGRIDLMRIGVLGHSRGGGGAARLVDLFESSSASLDSLVSKGSSSDIKAVLLLAPVEGTEEDNRVTETALAVVLPYCDGDQQDLWGVAYYDASRYALPGDSGPKHSFEVIGANHNYFNTYWDPNVSPVTANDDWESDTFLDEGPFCLDDGNPSSMRLSSTEQRGTLLAIGGAFFRTYLRNAKAFLPFLRGEVLPPPSAKTEGIYVAYHPKDEPQARLDLNRLTQASEVTTNTLGGAVSLEGFSSLEFCDPNDAGASAGCLTNSSGFYQVARAPHGFFPDPTPQLRLGWEYAPRAGEDIPALVQDLPPGLRDVSAYRAFQFRAFVDFSDTRNPFPPLSDPFEPVQDFSILLHDGAGQSASVLVSSYSRALFFPPPDDEWDNDEVPIPHAILNTVRVPLSAFPGLFLTDIRSVEIVFDQTSSGAINVADFAFADEAANTPPSLTCQVAEPVLMAAGDQLQNIGLDVQVADDADPGIGPTISVYSDEDDLDGGPNEASPDAKDIAPGTLRLRQENDSNGDGRVYLILATAQDSDGSLGSVCCTSVVPAGNQPDDLALVQTQADQALDQCTSFAGASIGKISIPAGYFAVGDGPVIGPKQ